MMSLSDAVKAYTPNFSNGCGFHNFNCPLCTDKKRRGGIKFDNGCIGYYCFNCSERAMYTPGKGLSKKLRSVFEFLGVPDQEIRKCLFEERFVEHKFENKSVELKEFVPVNLPEKSYSITGDAPPEVQEWIALAKSYLSIRNIDYTNYKFYLSETLGLQWLIIPSYYKNELIFWQGRNLDPSSKQRFTSASTVTGKTEGLIYNMDELEAYSSEPVFITEGIFDALSLPNGVCTFGGSISEKQKIIINRCAREKVWVMDKDKVGHQSAQVALDNDWSISYMSNHKDVNSCSQEYGRLYTIYDIMLNKRSGLEAQVKLNFLKTSG